MTATNDVEHLSVDECWSLLRTATVGRLAVIVGDHPEIFPINYVVDHGTAVFRTGEGSKVQGALSGTSVALESDGYDPETGRVWSVVVKGRARTIAEIDDVMDTVDLPLSPWQAGDKGRFIRITPGEVTGRRFPIADPSTWQTMPEGFRRASTE
ncbi:pyridoxamine 5'-phosphate oxidase family protein [Janibacter cremeus]|uniref:pyridoxamine 5'-phosphate oxidase family protein n=1 Tax=Janibacter cremeus TaxID=1285192 RepID=UPI0023F8D6F3|nr:pyridoxamine 5'-phosphate oxidase family protein [Janibacter cremeus]WEV77274.1 pyridoxamine 5'-phosphate oxidase family protein [Janibacter cremeus]